MLGRGKKGSASKKEQGLILARHGTSLTAGKTNSFDMELHKGWFFMFK